MATHLRYSVLCLLITTRNYICWFFFLIVFLSYENVSSKSLETWFTYHLEQCMQHSDHSDFYWMIEWITGDSFIAGNWQGNRSWWKGSLGSRMKELCGHEVQHWYVCNNVRGRIISPKTHIVIWDYLCITKAGKEYLF